MPTYQPTGVLLVNLGTPDAPTTAAVRRFLKQFLSDPRVVDYPRLPWWIILNGFILRVRPSRSAALYRKIWTDAGSPLMVHSKALADGIRSHLADTVPGRSAVELGMTYGKPSIAAAIDALRASGAQRLIVLPLYPQYSSTTTASVSDVVTVKLQAIGWQPETRFVEQYHDDPGYIEALAVSVREYWRENGRGEHLLMSFHGVPQSTVSRGDPYFEQCHETGRLLAAALELASGEWTLSFQSRVGREEWLRPYTDETVTALADKGVGRLDVVCPGFSTDCLETLEEIAMQNAALFTESGGKALYYIPALNARPGHVALLADLINQHLAGQGTA